MLLVKLCAALYSAIVYGSEAVAQENTRFAVLGELVGTLLELIEPKWA